jgi:hypothetical protein
LFTTVEAVGTETSTDNTDDDEPVDWWKKLMNGGTAGE